MAFTSSHAIAHSNFTRQTCNNACGVRLAARRIAGILLKMTGLPGFRIPSRGETP
jgi:hypothetical protein